MLVFVANNICGIKSQFPTIDRAQILHMAFILTAIMESCVTVCIFIDYSQVLYDHFRD